jgi:hypothetical protein
MGQGTRGRMRKAGRTKRKSLPESMVEAYRQPQFEQRVKRGVVSGAEPVTCEVCGKPSEGWLIEDGKRTWYHFNRLFNCVQRFEHMPASGPQASTGPV